MTSADLPAVLAIADRVHVKYPEDDAVVAERQRIYPDGCAVYEVDGKISAYTLTHPWHYAKPPALNVMLGRIPEHPSTYYIHDLAFAPEARGSGAAAAIVQEVIAHAGSTGVPNLSLVAVNNSVPFWSRFGFEVVAEPTLAEKLLTYDADARFMVRKLPA